MSQSSFVHLHVHSAYSLAESAIKVRDLIARCKADQMPAVAVTDTNNLFGAMEFALAAKDAGIQPIIGAQLTVSYDEGQLFQVVLLVQNDAGYRNLCKLMSDAYLHGDGDQAEVQITPEELYKHADGLICLSGGVKSAIVHAIAHGQLDKAETEVLALKEAFGDRFYLALQRHGWAGEEASEDGLIDLAYKHDVPLVATNDCYFPEKKGYEAHDALLCIAGGRYVTEDDRRKVTPEHYFKSAKEMCKLFEDVPEAIANTLVIAQRCSYLLEPIAPILPPFACDEGRTEFEELKAQATEGLKWRLKHAGETRYEEEDYFKRLDFELGIIDGMGFPGYFLIVSDFIKWAKEHDIPVGPGRGSGAGSVVAWALKITDLDPLELELLFERFLNPERVSMPDFDIDFCQERREEVIKYVQDKYGYNRVAQIITFGKLQARAVVRDVGRVLQMPYGQVDRLAKMIPNNPANPITLEQALAEDADLRAERDKDEVTKKLINIALQLEGLYRHASTHAAGVVIGDRDLHELIPLYRDPRSPMPVTQFNMKYVEQAGLVKFDFLGLKTMTVVQKTLDMVKANKGIEIDSLEIPLDDAPTYELMAKGHTVGVFQLESAGMRDTLRKVKPNRFDDIIALISLYRPGPMDNIPAYVDIKDGRQEPDYMHPVLEPLLKDTYGIMIYQEQVMQAAQFLAGYTLGGADLLRRAMGKKVQSEMDEQRQIFIEGSAEKHNVPASKADEIFDQINKFAGYGFNKSHAAAYALIGYWTAYLKCHYPLEFMAASMTLDLGNTDKLAVFKQDLDKMGVPLKGPDINQSYATFVVDGDGVRYALGALKGVGEAAMTTLVAEREANGSYKSIDDYASRLDPKAMNKRQFERMAAAGAFDALNDNRAQMREASSIILQHANSLREEREVGQVNLFGGGDDGGGLGLPALPTVKPWDALERLAYEFEAVGFYLSAHPLDSRAQQFENLRIAGIAQVETEMADKIAARYQMAGVLLKKQVKVSQKGSKYAFLQLSDPSGIFEVMVFSEVLAMAQPFLEVGNMLLLTVNAEVKEDQLRMLADKISPLDDALETKIKEIQIHLRSADHVQQIKDALDQEGRGIAQISLYIDLPDQKRAHLELPGRWALGAQTRNELRALDSIVEIREA